MKKMLALMLLLCLLPLNGLAEYKVTKRNLAVKYDTDTLKYTLEEVKMNGTVCYVTKIWMAEPARQIKKAISPWHEKLAKAEELAKKITGAAVVINGSGYVSPTYPEIPDNYPGTSADYYYTPLGSLTVVDGEVYRNLEGVPYYGLTLEEDGLHMYVGADNAEVLSASPSQTWSFYVECPMLLNNRDILPEEWEFADHEAARTIIARVDANNYLILSVTNKGRSHFGMTLREAVRFFQDHFDTEWVYDLDGGPSSALLCRKRENKKFATVMGGTAKDADIMAFTELPEE